MARSFSARDAQSKIPVREDKFARRSADVELIGNDSPLALFVIVIASSRLIASNLQREQ